MSLPDNKSLQYLCKLTSSFSKNIFQVLDSYINNETVGEPRIHIGASNVHRGSTLLGLLPVSKNYRLNSPISSPCYLWVDPNAESNELLLSVSVSLDLLDLSFDEIAFVKSRRAVNEKLQKIREQLKTAKNENHIINIRSFLWYYTRAPELWVKGDETYEDLLSMNDIPEKEKFLFRYTGEDKIMSCCGNSNCINPEHLTNIPAPWLKKTINIKGENIPKVYQYKNLSEDPIIMDTFRRLIREGANSNQLTFFGFPPEKVKLLTPYLRNRLQVHPFKLDSGVTPLSDNFKFDGFNTLNKNETVRGLGKFHGDLLEEKFGKDGMLALKGNYTGYKQLLEMALKLDHQLKHNELFSIY